jgi:lipoprotein-releasing system permease protein
MKEVLRIDEKNSTLSQALLPYSGDDIANIFAQLFVATPEVQSDESDFIAIAEDSLLQKRLKDFFDHIVIKKVKSPVKGLLLEPASFQSEGTLSVLAFEDENEGRLFYVPSHLNKQHSVAEYLRKKGYDPKPAKAFISKGQAQVKIHEGSHEISISQPRLYLDPQAEISSYFDMDSLKGTNVQEIKIQIQETIQNLPYSAAVAMQGLQLLEAIEAAGKSSPYMIYKNIEDTQEIWSFPTNTEWGEPILLPKSFRDAGVRIGDQGFITYIAPTASSIQEQRLPIFIAGFYDPGIFPLGARFILARSEVLSFLNPNSIRDERFPTNGINVRFTDLKRTDEIKKELIQGFKNEGLLPYFHIESYKDFEFSKEIIQQLQSERNLFTLISTVIIIVACSNIISMLIILVNNKKEEIGILRSMGANSTSIALIFGLSGVLMGLMGSIIGIILAIATLKNLNGLVGVISKLQGFEMFNANIYGKNLPTDLSLEAIAFVLVATACVSLVAGIVPAVKACLLKPSEILRSE